MVAIYVKNLRADRVSGSFDSDTHDISLKPNYTWVKHYWRFNADVPYSCEWRIEDDRLEYRIDSEVWTLADFIGAPKVEWFNLARNSDGVWMQIGVLNGRVVKTLWDMSDIRDDVSDYGEIYNKVLATHTSMSKLKGYEVKPMPDFTPEQLEFLREKISARYLESAKAYVASGFSKPYLAGVKAHEARLAEIGFEPPAFDFKKPDPIEIPLYRLGEAVFCTPIKCRGGENCDCANCEHNQAYYEEDDSCGCGNCMDNLDHWVQNGKNRDHCNFCKEFAKHRGVEEED